MAHKRIESQDSGYAPIITADHLNTPQTHTAHIIQISATQDSTGRPVIYALRSDGVIFSGLGTEPPKWVELQPVPIIGIQGED